MKKIGKDYSDNSGFQVFRFINIILGYLGSILVWFCFWFEIYKNRLNIYEIRIDFNYFESVWFNYFWFRINVCEFHIKQQEEEQWTRFFVNAITKPNFSSKRNMSPIQKESSSPKSLGQCHNFQFLQPGYVFNLL